MVGKKTSKRKQKTGLKRKSKDPIKIIRREELDFKRKLHKFVNGIKTEVVKKDKETVYSYRFVYPVEFVEFCMGVAVAAQETIRENRALAQADRVRKAAENSGKEE